MKETPGLQLRSEIRQIETYWHAIRAGALAPRRQDVDPRGLQNILAQTFLIEHLDDLAGRLRVAGRGIAQIAGGDARGLRFAMLFRDQDRNAARDILVRVVQEPTIALGTLIIRGQSQPAQFWLAPLLDDNGNLTRILGCLTADDDAGQGPVSLTRVLFTPLDGGTVEPETPSKPDDHGRARQEKTPPQMQGRPKLKLLKFPKED